MDDTCEAALTTDAVTLRTFGPADDISALTALLHRAYAPLAARGMRYLASHQDDATTLRRISGGECWVAQAAGQLVGTITLRDAAHTSGCPWYDRPDVASFGQFAVDPDWQRRGVGTLLVQHVERRAREKSVAELALDTAETADDLIAFYTRRGYRFIEHVCWDVVNYRSVVMSKTLG
jgi:GNAT superfamily N-acetyltransferase